MRIFLQDRGNQEIERRRTYSTPHNTIPMIDKEIAKKDYFGPETRSLR
jgi:hypothetical protein